MEIKPRDFFKYSFVINIEDERYENYKKVFKYYRLPLSERSGEPRKENQTPVQNIRYNHIQCVKKAKERNYPFVLILEDDTFPCSKLIAHKLFEFIRRLNNTKNIKNDFDIILLGRLIIDKALMEPEEGDYFYRHINEKGLYGGHAYLISGNFISKFLELSRKMRVADDFESLRRNKVKIFVPKENLFLQSHFKPSTNFKSYAKKLIPSTFIGRGVPFESLDKALGYEAKDFLKAINIKKKVE